MRQIIAAENDKDRANNFDGLRIIAALLVLCSHMFALSGRWEPRFVGDHSFGNLGVLIFFSISGYLVTASWTSDPNVVRFLLRRSLRIVPGLAVAVVASNAAVSTLGLSGFPGNPLHPLNGSLWTIPFEVYCYLLIGGLGLFTRIPAPLLTLGLLTAHAFLPESFLSYFGLFFANGAMLQQYPRLRTGYSLIGYAVASAVFFLISDTIIGLALIVPPMALWFGTRSWPILNTAGRYGDLSYGVYIYAWPVQQVVVATFGSTISYFALLVPSLAFTFLLAWVSWNLVEHPALFFKPKHRMSTTPSRAMVKPLVYYAQRELGK